MNRLRTKHINKACVDAERLYKTYCEWIIDYECTTEEQCDKILKSYYETLDYLKSEGIGGVLINGIFRDLSN